MSPRYIQVYEHESLCVGKELLDARTGKQIQFTPEDHQALERYYGFGTTYYTLIHRGVKFNQYVGVLRVGLLTIEVLPKADNGNENKSSWQHFLITMLRTAGIVPETTGTASLKLKSDSILELYLQLFLQEVRYLMQTGLIRKYRKTEGNRTALKGIIQFAQQLRHNSIHAERFYVRHTVYDQDTLFNALLLKGLQLVKKIAIRPDTHSEAARLTLGFPTCGDVRITEDVFEKLHFDRKTMAYQKAIGITRLLLLHLHPDVQRGKTEVLALMFNMNALWEQYVFQVLRHSLYGTGFHVSKQVTTHFWKPEESATRTVRPDMIVYKGVGKEKKAVLVMDTKWKCPYRNKIDDSDLKQMLVYNLYQKCEESALLYPAAVSSRNSTGTFLHGGSSCRALFLRLETDIQQGIRVDFRELLGMVKSKI